MMSKLHPEKEMMLSFRSMKMLLRLWKALRPITAVNFNYMPQFMLSDYI